MSPDGNIDHGAPLTPYRQLAGILRAQIQRGDWQPGRMLPSEAQLVQRYGIARTTVRRGLGLLADEGWVDAVPQRGWFVTDTLPPSPETPASPA
ncbi:GntR family transcriptional regulator [Streptomyces akebiae]|uniref:GntR family transcriptional regulator n=1 Tax=Streptomyces akebiae TaxID=2865673 RepID=A0ABX8XRH6_9ACTN|nr:GntR family transcriptional regulator [Streptomyces akebiae]QYX78533.1 GntR family transcriptional regulator [Streptomyces akebiae]